LGDAIGKTNQLIRSGYNARLDAQAFRNSLRGFITKHYLGGILGSIASPDPADISELLRQEPRFVRQLRIIDLEPKDIIAAVSDFLQASSCKTEWAENGLITSGSLDQFDSDLERAYRYARISVTATNGSITPQLLGQSLYSRCCSQTQKMDGRELPTVFVPGCYHALADDLRVGWHPAYANILAPDNT
jgi:hypothetical protein